MSGGAFQIHTFYYYSSIEIGFNGGDFENSAGFEDIFYIVYLHEKLITILNFKNNFKSKIKII